MCEEVAHQMCHLLAVIKMMYVGIDIGADDCTAAIVDKEGQTLQNLNFLNENDGWEELTRMIEKDSKVAMRPARWGFHCMTSSYREVTLSALHIPAPLQP